MFQVDGTIGARRVLSMMHGINGLPYNSDLENRGILYYVGR